MVLRQVKHSADEFVRFLLFHTFQLYEICTVNQIQKK